MTDSICASHRSCACSSDDCRANGCRNERDRKSATSGPVAIDISNADFINVHFRHCRIGKVTRKAKPVDLFPVIRSWPATPKDWWKQPFPVYDPLEDIMIGANRGCSCRPGQACGNVACPHMLTVSNATFPAAFA